MIVVHVLTIALKGSFLAWILTTALNTGDAVAPKDFGSCGRDRVHHVPSSVLMDLDLGQDFSILV